MKWIKVGDFIRDLPPMERKIFEVLEAEALTDPPLAAEHTTTAMKLGKKMGVLALGEVAPWWRPA
jgi:hypothetical protein